MHARRHPSSSESAPAPRPLVLATGNPAKAREMAALLDGVPFRIVHLADFPGVTLPAEGETSYAENALGKARAVASATGEMALADDSGIEVDALRARPGVVSARYGSRSVRSRALPRDARGDGRRAHGAPWRTLPLPDRHRVSATRARDHGGRRGGGRTSRGAARCRRLRLRSDLLLSPARQELCGNPRGGEKPRQPSRPGMPA